jgi:GH43 family beta-xylosidase
MSSWVIRNEGYYYMTYTTNDNVSLLRIRVLMDWDNAESKPLFQPPQGMDYSTDLWGPEIHQFDDK